MATPPSLFPSSGSRVVRVLTDNAGIDKEFDYLVPDGDPLPAVGTELRLNLSGRRVGGWVTGSGVPPIPGMALRAYSKVRGFGPEPELVDLAGWAAWRWAGRRASLLRSASADFAVPALPAPGLNRPVRPPRGAIPAGILDDLPVARPCLLRLPPAFDPTPVVAELAQAGPTLVVVPTSARAAVLGARLGRAGADVAVLPGDWARARAGAAVVVGARAAAWAPCPDLESVIVLDGHDEALGQEQAPTWHAVEVAAERARRSGRPCVIISACPTPELLALCDLRTVDRTTERKGWATVEVVDRRGEDPRLGLYSSRLVNVVRGEGRVLCVLNRTGRARLLACAACGDLARCESCGRPVQADAGTGTLRCAGCGLQRPPVCTSCFSTTMKLLRIGVSKAREDLEALAGEPVGELSAVSTQMPSSRVVVGTEAALHRFSPSDGLVAAVFVDFDQELLAPRMRAADEALGLLALASRLVKGRRGRLVIQTRIPNHAVVRAAQLADPALVSDEELEVRRALAMPPFSHVALISGAGSASYAAALRERPGAPVAVIGPDRDTWLVKSLSPEVLAEALAGTARPADPVRVAVDPARM